MKGLKLSLGLLLTCLFLVVGSPQKAFATSFEYGTFPNLAWGEYYSIGDIRGDSAGAGGAARVAEGVAFTSGWAYGNYTDDPTGTPGSGWAVSYSTLVYQVSFLDLEYYAPDAATVLPDYYDVISTPIPVTQDYYLAVGGSYEGSVSSQAMARIYGGCGSSKIQSYQVNGTQEKSGSWECNVFSGVTTIGLESSVRVAAGGSYLDSFGSVFAYADPIFTVDPDFEYIDLIDINFVRFETLEQTFQLPELPPAPVPEPSTFLLLGGGLIGLGFAVRRRRKE